jgi:hypothetical protein
MRRLGMLIAGTLCVWAVLALPAALLLGGPPYEVSIAAAMVCLVPAVLTLFLADRLRDRPPEEKIVIALVCTFLRMGLAVGLGVLLYFQVPLLRTNAAAFIGWGVVFYLVTLALETALLYRDTVRPGTQSN